MSWLTALVLIIPALLAMFVAWELGARAWRQRKGSNAHHVLKMQRGRRLNTHPSVNSLHLRRWQLVLLATVVVVAGVYYYSAKDDTPLAAVMCVNGADASGHSWPDELGRPDPCTR